MGLVDKLKSLAGEPDRQTYRYRCGDCKSTFEASVTHPKDATCVECGSERIHTAL